MDVLYGIGTTVLVAVVVLMIRQMVKYMTGKQDKTMCIEIRNTMKENQDKLEKKVDEIDKKVNECKDSMHNLDTNVAVILTEIKKFNGNT